MGEIQALRRHAHEVFVQLPDQMLEQGKFKLAQPAPLQVMLTPHEPVPSVVVAKVARSVAATEIVAPFPCMVMGLLWVS